MLIEFPLQDSHPHPRVELEARGSDTLYSVNFLRFVAALAVVIHHIAAAFGTTILVFAAGVDVFFVISGLVIVLSTRPGETVKAFALKRFIRVLPMYWVTTGVYIAVRYWVWTEIPPGAEILRSLSLIPKLEPGYLPLYYPAWSLSFELFFYCVYGTLLALLPKQNLPVVALAILSVLGASVLPIPGILTQLFLEFVFGIVIYLLLDSKLKLNRSSGFALVCGAIVCFGINGNSLDFRAVEWGVPAFLLVLGCVALEASRFFRHKLCVLGGNASYSIYLTHITVHNAAYKFIVPLPPTGTAMKIVACVLEIAVALVVGVLVHLYFEKPMLKVLRARLAFLSRTPETLLPAR